MSSSVLLSVIASPIPWVISYEIILKEAANRQHASDDEDGDEGDDQGKLDGVSAAPVAQQGDDVILKIRQHAYRPR